MLVQINKKYTIKLKENISLSRPILNKLVVKQNEYSPFGELQGP